MQGNHSSTVTCSSVPGMPGKYGWCTTRCTRGICQMRQRRARLSLLPAPPPGTTTANLTGMVQSGSTSSAPYIGRSTNSEMIATGMTASTRRRRFPSARISSPGCRPGSAVSYSPATGRRSSAGRCERDLVRVASTGSRHVDAGVCLLGQGERAVGILGHLVRPAAGELGAAAPAADLERAAAIGGRRVGERRRAARERSGERERGTEVGDRPGEDEPAAARWYLRLVCHREDFLA